MEPLQNIIDIVERCKIVEVRDAELALQLLF